MVAAGSQQGVDSSMQGRTRREMATFARSWVEARYHAKASHCSLQQGSMILQTWLEHSCMACTLPPHRLLLLP